MRMDRGRIADGPLAMLLVLATLFVAALSSFVARQTLPYDPFVACETLLTTWIARLTSLGLLLPLALLAMILLAGALALAHQLWATRKMISGLLAKRLEPRPARLSQVAAAVGLTDRTDLVDDPAAFVFCYGYLRPRVILSTGMLELLDASELSAVLAHERHHLQHHDPLKILFGRSLASALFFLPLAGALRNSYLAGKEICADLEALASAGSEALASAVLKSLSAEPPSWPAGVLAVGSLSPTQARLERLVLPQSARRPWASVTDWLLSAALAAAIFGFGYGSVVASQSEPIDNACSTMTAPSEHREAADGLRADPRAGASTDGPRQGRPAPAASSMSSLRSTPSLGAQSCRPACALLECRRRAAPR